MQVSAAYEDQSAEEMNQAGALLRKPNANRQENAAIVEMLNFTRSKERLKQNLAQAYAES